MRFDTSNVFNIGPSGRYIDRARTRSNIKSTAGRYICIECPHPESAGRASPPTERVVAILDFLADTRTIASGSPSWPAASA